MIERTRHTWFPHLDTFWDIWSVLVKELGAGILVPDVAEMGEKAK